MKSRLFLLLFLLTPLAANALPSWIWKTPDGTGNAHFRKTFTVEGEIKSAILTLGCKNAAKATINGKLAFENFDWKHPGRTDVTQFLHTGENDVVINGYNDKGGAGLLVSIVIETADGKKTAIQSDETWKAAAADGEEWSPVAVVGKYGDAPWGDVLLTKGEGKVRPKQKEPAPAINPAEIVAPPGFKVDVVYTVPRDTQGSWVSMTVDPKGRLICGDQYGGLYRVTLPPAGSKDDPKVEPINAEISGAHGLLYAFDALYVMVCETTVTEGEKKVPTGRKQGIWRLKYRASDDQFETPELLRTVEGTGEHGPHGLVLGPDGKSIYFVAGNHTKLPDHMEISRAAYGAWGEDHLLPRMWDPRGHARGKLAPGGYTCKADPDFKKVEMFCAGFRNHYDTAFDANGEMFTYDSDMEWDMGTPWYMPTRINHSVSGGDYGWRSGAGRWPAYYADSLPAVVNIGPGSPTGAIFGTGAKFPAKYQRAFFANDWTYGTLYAIHLTPDGATFKGVKEEFITGKPLPLTDIVINPKDSAMYFLTGGRMTQSTLYRVTYHGKESTKPVKALPPTPEAKIRRDLEKLHVEGTGPEAIDKAWPYLGHKDRFIRWAARVAIERQPSEKWADRALALKAPQALLEGMIALARVGDKALQPRVLESLERLSYAKLDSFQQLALLRAYELAFTRMGKPAAEVCAKLATKFDALYPQKDSLANRELCQLLIFLDSPKVVSKTLSLMATAKDDLKDIASASLLARNKGYGSAVENVHGSRPNQQQIAYMYSLRNAKTGWTPELRKTYFSWFPHTAPWKGGNSFRGFLDNTRIEALDNFVPKDERDALAELSSKVQAVAANIVPPKGPGQDYTVESALSHAKNGLKGRNFEDGRNMFNALNCGVCHRFNGDGGSVGPDITGSGSRYTLHDLLENIIEPSKVISDQYESTEIETKDGSFITGRILSEENGKISVMTNPFAPDDLVLIDENNVKSKTASKTSIMPPGLVNVLNPDELLDLLAYLQSGGNPKDKVFKK